MSNDTPLYSVLKGRAYPLVQIATGRGNTEAQTAGHKDVFDLLMSDSDSNAMPVFIGLLMKEMPSEGHRRVLLDGLAREYAEKPDWMAYVDQETSESQER